MEKVLGLILRVAVVLIIYGYWGAFKAIIAQLKK